VFLRLPTEQIFHFQDIVLILNTVLLIIALIIFEVAYSVAPKKDKKHLKIFYPFVVLFVIILLYAVYVQVGKS
jgi:hypothetical protein